MACPFFFPVAPAAGPASESAALLPLGDAWTGHCHTDSARPTAPDAATSSEYCNRGYARGHCARFPSDAGTPDAVRFTVRGDDEACISLYFTLEHNHYPHAHGPLEWSRARQCFTTPHASALLTRQATAYVESYLRRKHEAGGH